MGTLPVVTLYDGLRPVVGSTAAALADALDLHTVGDLLRHYPRRYAERGELTDLARLEVGEHATVLAEVRRASTRRMRNRPGTLLEVSVGDGRRSLALTFFNQPWRQRELRPGVQALFAGTVRDYRGTRQLSHPDYVLVDVEAGGREVAEFAGALLPVYPATVALPSWTVARAVRLALDALDEPDDPLPDALRGRHSLLGLGDALRAVHRPPDRRGLEAARRRLKWDEAMVLQVTLAQRRATLLATPATPRHRRPGGIRDAFDARLPFALTQGQRTLGETLDGELALAHPMHRLLQGEVGSGKTVVALRAMLAVVDAGGQAALLAPTEVLATQHARTIAGLLGPLGHAGELTAPDETAAEATRVALLTGSLGAAARRTALAEAADGRAGVVVGTHALLEERVAFVDLGLVVVDEQHRFGVEQRDALRSRGDAPPHVLVMTATPIPRTVAMTVFGDLETSTLTELPGGRTPVTSHVVPSAEKPAFLERAWQRLCEEVAAGHQAFVVCPRIGDDLPADGAPGGPGAEEPQEPEEPAGDAQEAAAEAGRRPGAAVLEVLALLRDGPLAGLRVAALHGRMAADDKDAVMTSFAAGTLDVLVATTVVEVGVDVPNATVMVVLDADRFGVSQLHQLRGRIGRGSAPGLCLLVTDAPAGTPSRERVEAVAATLDGAELARLDLRQRGEGDVLGATQSGGRRTVRLLELLADEDLIAAAREEATALVAADPDLTGSPALARALADALDPDRAAYLEKG